MNENREKQLISSKIYSQKFEQKSDKKKNKEFPRKLTIVKL